MNPTPKIVRELVRGPARKKIKRGQKRTSNQKRACLRFEKRLVRTSSQHMVSYHDVLYFLKEGGMKK